MYPLSVWYWGIWVVQAIVFAASIVVLSTLCVHVDCALAAAVIVASATAPEKRR